MVGKGKWLSDDTVTFCRVLHYTYEQERKQKKKKELSPLNDTGREEEARARAKESATRYLDDDDNGDNGKRPVVSELPAPFFALVYAAR